MTKIGDTRTVPLTRHPAKYSEPILEQLARMVDKEQRRLGRPIVVVDPFAGVGRIHQLAGPKVRTIGLEIEREWAACHRDTLCVDAMVWLADLVANRRLAPRLALRVDLFVTSFCYGNRLADHHDAKDGSERRSYRHDLGRMPSEGSAAVLPFGPRYKSFHARADRLIHDALTPGARFILNVSDIVSGKRLVPSATWHEGAAMGAGFELVPRGTVRVPTKRLRFGENHGHDAAPGEETRAEFELIYTFERPHHG